MSELRAMAPSTPARSATLWSSLAQRSGWRVMAAFLWELIRPSWAFALTAFAANLLAALFEGSSIGMLVVALQALSASAEGSGAGRILAWVTHWHPGMSREALFVGLVSVAVLAQIVRSGLQFLAILAAARVQVSAQLQLHHRLFARLIHQRFPRASRYRFGELTDLLAQSRGLHEALAHVNLVVSNALLAAIYGALLFWISWPMTLAALAMFWLVSRGLQRLIGAVRRLAHKTAEMATVFSRQTTEFLQALRLLHTFARQEDAVRVADDMARDWMKGRGRVAVMSAAIPMTMDIASVLGVVVFLVGGYVLLGPKGGASLVHLLAFLLALHRMSPRVSAVHASLAHLAVFAPHLAHIMSALREPDEAAPSRPGRAAAGVIGAIAFRGVTLQYQSDESPAVSELSFTVPRGSLTALVGVSGAGKSSVVDLVLQLYLPTAGHILVDGVDVQTLDLRSWRERLGVVSQEPFLFHASIRDNIAFGKPDATMDEIIAAARAAHAHEFITRLSGGYETVVGDRGYGLSGGQRQRIALARALVRRPEILILDEATSALDSESERLIQQTMEEQRGSRTVIAIAHRLSTVAHADQILVLEDGRLVEQGIHEELLARGEIYARLWQLQSEHHATMRLREAVGG